MSTLIDNAHQHTPMNPVAQLWLITHGGWRVRADQLVALCVGRNRIHNSDESRFAITARVAYDPKVTCTLAQFDDENLAQQSLAKLLERMADWNRGFGTAAISRHTGGVIISKPRSRPSGEEEEEASAS